MSFKTDLEEKIKSCSESRAYLNYQEILPKIQNMVDEFFVKELSASDYWKEEIDGFDYIFDASPLIVAKLREQSYHLTGLKSYEYRDHHNKQAQQYQVKLDAIKAIDTDNLFVPEADVMGGFGHKLKDGMANMDTLKFYEVLVALNRSGVLANFRQDQGERKTLLEIGAGWGGFAYQFKQHCPNNTYVILDLPHTMIFSATYLKTIYPDMKFAFYGDEPLADLLSKASEFDFIFLPAHVLSDLSLPKLDLTINMVSFQEMTTEQVRAYVHKVHSLGCPTIYSLNRNRSKYNTQLSDVYELIGEKYELERIKMLRVPYTDLNPNRPKEKKVPKWKKVLRLVKEKKKKKPTVNQYSHHVGRLKS